MAWLCPKCKKLQHYASKCKFCGHKNEIKLTVNDLQKLKKFKMPEKYWVRKRKTEKHGSR